MAPLAVDVKGAGEAVGALLGGLGDFGIKLRTAITGKLDPAKEAELVTALANLEAAGRQAQVSINLAEAGSSNLFVAGWRPYVGWVLGTCAAAYFLPKFLAAAIMWTLQVIHTGQLLPYPDVGWADVAGLLVGMLGLTTQRTVEKVKGAAGNH